MDEIHDPDQRREPGFVPVIESDLSRLFSILNDEETSKIGLFDDFWIEFRSRKRKHTVCPGSNYPIFIVSYYRVSSK